MVDGQYTNQTRVDAMLSSALHTLTGSATDDQAWEKIFVYYNHHSRGLQDRGYKQGEEVAVEINLNNSNAAGPGDIVNVSLQVALAMVRQLVIHARGFSKRILIHTRAQRAVMRVRPV
jgi:hypothetical protein